GSVESTSTPGAVTSTSSLRLENGARASASSTAPTETTSALPAGYSTALVPSLPAAATSTDPPRPPRSQAYFTAAAMVREAPPPRLMEMTLAPWSCVQRMQAATSASLPLPSAESALQTTSGEENATPA